MFILSQIFGYYIAYAKLLPVYYFSNYHEIVIDLITMLHVSVSNRPQKSWDRSSKHKKINTFSFYVDFKQCPNIFWRYDCRTATF